MTATRSARAAGAGCGLLAAAAGLGASEGVAALISAPSPVVSVGEQAIDRAPPALKDFAIETFGAADKPVLVAGVLVVLAVIAAVAGAIGVTRRPLALSIAGAVGMVGLVAAVVGSSITVPPVPRLLPALTALGVSVGGLAALLATLAAAAHRRAVAREQALQAELAQIAAWSARNGRPLDLGRLSARPAATSAGASDRLEAAPDPTELDVPTKSAAPDGFDRRRFLAVAVAVGGVGAIGGGYAWVGARRVDPGALDLPDVADPAPPLPPAASFDEIGGLSPLFTPNEDFYRVDTTLLVPQVELAEWRLRIHGMVEREIELDFAQLVERPLIERDITLACVSNSVGGPYVGNARWIGTPLKDLIEEAGPLDGADAVLSTSVDGMTIGTPLEALLDGRDALLAVGMNGEPLPAAHGFPVRMVVPGLYGYVSATKWVVDLEVTRFADFEAFWTPRGWAERAPVKVASRIDVPRPLARFEPGPVVIAGVAWAQHRGIGRVEVRVDDGPWQEAELSAELSVDSWRQWRYEWDAAGAIPGDHEIAVRATTGDGETQTAEEASPRPDGATGWHSVVITVT